MIGQDETQFKEEPPAVFGIDPSLRGTGLAYLADGEFDLIGLPEKKLVGVERLAALRTRLRNVLDILADYRTFAVIEGYSYDSVGRLAQLGEWGGVIRVELYTRGIQFVVPTPAQLKQFVTGRGDATKEQMIEAVESVYGLEVADDDDLADAAGLARLGYVYLTGDSQRRCELEVVKSMKAPKKKPKTFRRLKGV